MTVEVDGMVMFWQISYGLPARVHVTVCPGAGTGGKLQVPVGAARRGLEGAAVAVKAVNDARINTSAALRISRVERCVNIAVAFIEGLLAQKRNPCSALFAKNRGFLDASTILERGREHRIPMPPRVIGYHISRLCRHSKGMQALKN